MANHKKRSKAYRLVSDTRLSWEEEPTQTDSFVAHCDNENEARREIGRQGYDVPALDAWLVCGSDLEVRFRLVENSGA